MEKGLHTEVELVESDETGNETEEESSTVKLLVGTALCEGPTVTKDALEDPAGVGSAGVVLTTEELGGGRTMDDGGFVGRVLTDD